MGKQAKDEDGPEEQDSGDLKGSLKRLKKGPMNFALGYKSPREPMLLLSKTKSAQALANELKSKRGASKATHGTANADGQALVLDVEGPSLPGVKKLVRTLLKKEKISTFKDARVLTGGVESADEAADEETGDEADVQELRAELHALEKQVGAVLKRIQAPKPGDEELLTEYGELCLEYARQARESGDARLAAEGKTYAERGKKMVKLALGSAGDEAAALQEGLGLPAPPRLEDLAASAASALTGVPRPGAKVVLGIPRPLPVTPAAPGPVPVPFPVPVSAPVPARGAAPSPQAIEQCHELFLRAEADTKKQLAALSAMLAVPMIGADVRDGFHSAVESLKKVERETHAAIQAAKKATSTALRAELSERIKQLTQQRERALADIERVLAKKTQLFAMIAAMMKAQNDMRLAIIRNLAG